VEPQDWVAVGRLKRTRGNRGELVGEIYSSHPGREDQLKDVMLDLNGRRQMVAVEQIWRHDGRPVFKFAGIDSISQAEAWQGADVLVPRAELAGPEEGEYSHADLIGCTVVTARGAAAGAAPIDVVNAGLVTVGVVKGVEDYGGPSLLKVEAADGREILIPFARAICREVDVAAKTIRVDLPDGLLELQ
jgi:16S rRNA processing protein RimM